MTTRTQAPHACLARRARSATPSRPSALCARPALSLATLLLCAHLAPLVSPTQIRTRRHRANTRRCVRPETLSVTMVSGALLAQRERLTETVMRQPRVPHALPGQCLALEPRRALLVRLVWLTWTPTRPLSAALALLAATTPLPALRHARCARPTGWTPTLTLRHRVFLAARVPSLELARLSAARQTNALPSRA